MLHKYVVYKTEESNLQVDDVVVEGLQEEEI